MNNEDKFIKIWSNPILFIQSFMKIANKKGKVIPFKLNDMQRNFVNEMEAYNVILKARQGGMSVCIASLAIYYAITEPNCSCLMLSHTDESTRAIFNKLKAIYNSIPDVIKPKMIRNNRAELGFTNGSVITCHTLGKRDVGRGSTLKLIHISEFGFVGDQAQKQLLSLEQALRPDGHLIIESTANGLNYFHELYYHSKNHENAYKSFFFNYIDTASMFEDEYIKYKKIWKNIYNRDFTESDLNDDEKELYKIKGMTLDILCWRRLKIQNSGLDQFNQEYPIDDNLAFIVSGANVFDNKRIDTVERAIINDKTTYIKKENIIGLPVVLKNHYGRSFFIWKIPKSGERFYIGCDLSEGVGQDYSVVEVLNSDGEQVAEFYNNKLKPFEMAEIINEIGRYYNKGLITVEKASGGHSCIERLRYDYHYMNMTKYKSYDQFNKMVWNVGFDTNNKSKSMIINDFVELFAKGQLKINSRRVLQEMKVFEINDNGSMGAISGSHDDSVMATALAIVSLKNPFYYSF